MKNKRLEELELADVDEFLEKCHQRAKELGISLEYYLEEFV